MLKQHAILIAEDELYIALNLSFAVEDADGRVVGPAATVAEALALIDGEAIVGAILDVNLADGDISAVVEKLGERGVPVVLQTGVGLPAALAARFPRLSVHLKPCAPARLIAELAQMIDHQSDDATATEQER